MNDYTNPDDTRFATTSSGQKLPFKLFRPEDTDRFANLLENPNNDDFSIIERRFSEYRGMDFLGTEQLVNHNDVAWLFNSLEDEAVEHAFMVYHFKDSYFVQHISTGAFNQAVIENRALVGNILAAKPEAVTLVHNHPSGNLKASKADFDCLNHLRKALRYSDTEVKPGVIINLRSGKYLVFDYEDKKEEVHQKSTPSSELNQDIRAYSFSKQVLAKNYQPHKVINPLEVASFITSQKFGISDKTEMLVLNNQMHIVGKFLMPPANQANFIIEKVAQFGGMNCILYGNNISPEEINYYNGLLRHSNMSIVDGLLFSSDNVGKVYKSLMEEGLLNRDTIEGEDDISLHEPINQYKKLTQLENELSNLIPEERKGDAFLIKISKQEAEYLLAEQIVPDVMVLEPGHDDEWMVLTTSDFELATNKIPDEYDKFELDVAGMSPTNTKALLHEIEKYNSNLHEQDLFAFTADFDLSKHGEYLPDEFHTIQEKYEHLGYSGENNLERRPQLEDYKKDMEGIGFTFELDDKMNPVHFQPIKEEDKKELYLAIENKILSQALDRNPKKKEFSIEDAIQYQQQQLADWKKALQPEIFEALQQKVMAKNADARDGYDIVRGQDIETILHNDIINQKQSTFEVEQSHKYAGINAGSAGMSIDQRGEAKTQQINTIMKNLSWVDKNITPRTPAYKEFVNEMENSSPERFYQDGERIFTDSEKKFMQIYEHKKGIIPTITPTAPKQPLSPNELVQLITKTPVKLGYLTKDEKKLLLDYVQRSNEYLPLFDTKFIQKNHYTLKEVLAEEPTLINLFNEELQPLIKDPDYYVKQKLKEIYQSNSPGNILMQSLFDKQDEDITNWHNSENITTERDTYNKAIAGASQEALKEYASIEKELNDLGFKLNGSQIEEKLRGEVIAQIRTEEYEKKSLTTLINNQNPNIMATQEFDQVQYLKDQLKYLGFGEEKEMHKALEDGINNTNSSFTIHVISDKTLPENKVDFVLNFNKSEKGGVFLNSYDATLTNEKAETLTHNFPVRKDNSFTAKEAVNLMEGRAVKNEFVNPKTNEKESAFVKLNFQEDKNQWGNYNFQTFYKNYGIDVADIVAKSNLVFDKEEYKASTIASLEKGNIVKVKFDEGGNTVEGKAVLNAQYKNLSLYDNDMNRVNTNKPIPGLESDLQNEKANVREQSKSRGI